MTDPTPAPGPDEADDAAPEALGQLELMKRIFARHRLAVASVFVLALLYLAAAFAEFLAPNDPNRRRVEYAYAPPSAWTFSTENGLAVRGVVQRVDPVTLRKYYEADPSRDAPFRLCVAGDAYAFWGLFPARRHLAGVSGDRPGAVWLPLGADRFGRCVASRLVYGGRASLSVGLIGVALTLVLGVGIGGISGYAGGVADTLIQRLIEIVNALPPLPLWLALGAALPQDWPPMKTYFAVTLVLAFLSWTRLARVVRGKILSLREEDYAVAARLLGASDARILFRHLIPGFASHILVTATLAVPGMILGETSLSFLGLGLRPPAISWGVMLQDCMDVKAVTEYPWLIAPVLAIMLAVLSFNFVGDGLRDAADPYAGR